MRNAAIRLMIVLGALVPADAAASGADGSILVFLDCQGDALEHCDFDHIRREIPWVNWAREKWDADVHLLITAEVAGSESLRYSLDFIDQGEEEAGSTSLFFITDPDGTFSENRGGLTRTIALGLIRYAASSPAGRHLRIVRDEETPDLQVDAASDPWNLWTFRVSGSGTIEGEKLQRGHAVQGVLVANRTTEELKIDWRAAGNTFRDEFDIDSNTIVNVTRNHRTVLWVVWSLNEHWSAGTTAAAAHRTFDNLDHIISGGPAVEYNFYPYSLSTRKLVTIQYAAEAVRINYELPTVTGKDEETVGRHRLLFTTQIRQPWGQIEGSLSGIQYFNDPDTHRIDFFMGSSFRIFRGLSLDVSGSYSRIKDQFFLPATGSTPAEILLQRRQRETDYRFDVRLGLSYRFGSKVANVVNPRLGF